MIKNIKARKSIRRKDGWVQRYWCVFSRKKKNPDVYDPFGGEKDAQRRLILDMLDSGISASEIKKRFNDKLVDEVVAEWALEVNEEIKSTSPFKVVIRSQSGDFPLSPKETKNVGRFILKERSERAAGRMRDRGKIRILLDSGVPVNKIKSKFHTALIDEVLGEDEKVSKDIDDIIKRANRLKLAEMVPDRIPMGLIREKTIGEMTPKSMKMLKEELGVDTAEKAKAILLR